MGRDAMHFFQFYNEIKAGYEAYKRDLENGFGPAPK
eukprot:gene11448-3416_t